MDDLSLESLREDYHLESRERLADIEAHLVDVEKVSEAEREERLVAARRELHTLKGNSGMMGFGELQDFAHELEDQVEALRADLSVEEISAILGRIDRYRAMLDAACGVESVDHHVDDYGLAAAGHQGVRVSFAALDSIVDLLSEMVIFQNRHAEISQRALASLPKEERGEALWRDLESSRQTLDRTLDQIRQRIMRLRLVPLGNLFAQLKRAVFEESVGRGKDVELRATGGETPLDRALLEVTSEVLGHLVRNSVIHGIESPEERAAAGKPSRSTLTLVAMAGTEEVVIDVEDDGRGVDRRALTEKARGLGVEVPADAALEDLLFHPGLTTREVADKGAGRGMGLAAVAEAVRRHGGAVEAFSRSGRGTRFRLRLPITASILRGLGVLADGEEYVLPSGAVKEILDIDAEARHRIHRAGVVRWRDLLLPIVDLGATFATASGLRAEGRIVVVEADGQRRGLLVDEVTGLQDTVVKPLNPIVGHPDGVSGCTILGDGRVVMILDPRELAALPPTMEQTA